MDVKHHIGHRKRLREKLLISNLGVLHDYEILEILLFSGSPRKDVKHVARNLIEHFGSLSATIFADVAHLSAVKDMNESMVSNIKCVRELIYRIGKSGIKSGSVLNNWKKVLEFLKSNLASVNVERLIVIYLNNKYLVISQDFQDVGTNDETPLYVREVIKKALAIGASSLIISHNHPSGNCAPSAADIDLTNKLNKTCRMLDLTLIDHIIISPSSHFSFAENNLLSS